MDSASSRTEFAERALKPTMLPERAKKFLIRWLISVSSKRCRSRAFLSSVMSRAIFEAPTIRPRAFRIGEIVSEISARLPSFRCRTVSKW